MFDIVSTMSIFYKYEAHGERWLECLNVSIGVSSCMIRLFLLSPICTHITLTEVLWVNQLIYKILIQFCFNTPVYLAIVYALWLLWYVSGLFLAHNSMVIPLKRWALEVTESMLEVSLACSTYQYVYIKLDYYSVLLISTLSAMNKCWFGLSFCLKNFVLNTL